MVGIDLVALADAFIAIIAFVAMSYAWKKTKSGSLKTLINLLMAVIFLHILTQFYKVWAAFSPELSGLVFQMTLANNVFISLIFIMVAYFIIKNRKFVQKLNTS